MCQLYIKREEQTLEEARNLGRVKSSVFMESRKNIPIAQLSNTAKNSHSVVFHSSGKTLTHGSPKLCSKSTLQAWFSTVNSVQSFLIHGPITKQGDCEKTEQ